MPSTGSAEPFSSSSKVDAGGTVGAEVDAIVDDLVALAADLAADAIDRAEANGVPSADLAAARNRLAQGDADVAAGRVARAMVRYGQAWEAADKAAIQGRCRLGSRPTDHDP